MSRKLLSLGVLLAMLAVLVAGCAQPVPVAPSQGAAVSAGGGQAAAGAAAQGTPSKIVNGGTWTEASNADVSNLNPILYSDSASGTIVGYLYPGLIAGDPKTGQPTTGFGSMADSYTVSPDGLTWTFKLHDGVKWTDGQPVTSADFKFTYDAIKNDTVESPRKDVWTGIDSIETPDPLTIVVKYKELRCDALSNLGLGWLPSHLYKADFSDIMNSPDNTAPRVSAGPFKFQSWTRDDNVIVTRNDTYWYGVPHMDGSIVRVVPDPGARLAQLQSGEIDFLTVQPNQIASAEKSPNLERRRYYDDGYSYIGLNLANPKNPQNGRDKAGKVIPQDPHPILGDVKVRQAIAHAIDYQSIIDNILLGQGYPMAANVLPAIDWAVNKDLKPYTYDLDLAKKMLDDAGWKVGADGIREKNGMKMKLGLITNSGNTTREDIGTYVQDQLKKIGIDVDFQAIDFGTMLKQLDAQTYDMYILGWTGLGPDPASDQSFWSSEFDVVGSGFNNTSYNNAKVEDLLKKGDSVPGCKPEDRAPYYKEIQQIIHDEVPYIFLAGRIGNDFYNKNWGGIDPQPWSLKWNMEKWYQKSLQQ